MCVSEKENSSARLSQDEVDVTHQQLQQQSRRHGDDDGDGDGDGDGGGTTHEPHSPAEIRRDKHPHHRRHGDASAVASRRDVAVQVDDVTRQSSSSQVSHHM